MIDNDMLVFSELLLLIDQILFQSGNDTYNGSISMTTFNFPSCRLVALQLVTTDEISFLLC